MTRTTPKTVRVQWFVQFSSRSHSIYLFLDYIDRKRLENIWVDSESIFLRANYERKAFWTGVSKSFLAGTQRVIPSGQLQDRTGSQSEHRICFILPAHRASHIIRRLVNTRWNIPRSIFSARFAKNMPRSEGEGVTLARKIALPRVTSSVTLAWLCASINVEPTITWPETSPGHMRTKRGSHFVSKGVLCLVVSEKIYASSCWYPLQGKHIPAAKKARKLQKGFFASIKRY